MTLKFRMVNSYLPSAGITEVCYPTWFTLWWDGTQSLVNARWTLYQQSYMLSIWNIIGTGKFASDCILINYCGCSVSMSPAKLKLILYGQGTMSLLHFIPCTYTSLLYMLYFWYKWWSNRSNHLSFTMQACDRARPVQTFLCLVFFLRTFQLNSNLVSLWGILWEIAHLYSRNPRSALPGNIASVKLACVKPPPARHQNEVLAFKISLP